jgi:hypothetical protein
MSDALIGLMKIPSQKERDDLVEAGRIAESQLDELRNMRVLLEEARLLARNLAYHRRASLETLFGQTLDEIDRQIEDLRSNRN